MRPDTSYASIQRIYSLMISVAKENVSTLTSSQGQPLIVDLVEMTFIDENVCLPRSRDIMSDHIYYLGKLIWRSNGFIIVNYGSVYLEMYKSSQIRIWFYLYISISNYKLCYPSLNTQFQISTEIQLPVQRVDILYGCIVVH